MLLYSTATTFMNLKPEHSPKSEYEVYNYCGSLVNSFIQPLYQIYLKCQHSLIEIVRPLFFDNLFNAPTDSRFPKIRIKKKKLDFDFFYSPRYEFRVLILF